MLKEQSRHNFRYYSRTTKTELLTGAVIITQCTVPSDRLTQKGYWRHFILVPTTNRVATCISWHVIATPKKRMKQVKVKKVQKSLYRLPAGQRVPAGSGSQLSRQSAREGGNVASLTHWPPLPPRKYFWYSFLLENGPVPGQYCGRKDYVN
jgi:hypothetical protein